jgi:hypothetical protein
VLTCGFKSQALEVFQQREIILSGQNTQGECQQATAVSPAPNRGATFPGCPPPLAEPSYGATVFAVVALQRRLVDLIGIKPTTSSLRTKRSIN